MCSASDGPGCAIQATSEESYLEVESAPSALGASGFVLCVEAAFMLYLLIASRRRPAKQSADADGNKVRFDAFYAPSRAESAVSMLTLVGAMMIGASPYYLLGEPGDVRCMLRYIPTLVGALFVQLGLYLRVRTGLSRRTLETIESETGVAPAPAAQDPRDAQGAEDDAASLKPWLSRRALVVAGFRLLAVGPHLAVFYFLLVDLPVPTHVSVETASSVMSSQYLSRFICAASNGIGSRALAVDYFLQLISMVGLLAYLAILFARSADSVAS